jgi:hypothetical protein
MKRIFNILPVILMYLIVCGKSCDSGEQFTREREQRQALHARDSLVSAFEKDTLDPASLRAFEVTARLKLNDLSDYLKISRDSGGGKAFRDKAGQMAEALFVPGVKVPGHLSGAVFDSVRVSRALRYLNDSAYSGQMIMTVHFPGLIPRDRHSTSNLRAEFFAVKRMKIFGRDTLRVWNVLLGEIR